MYFTALETSEKDRVYNENPPSNVHYLVEKGVVVNKEFVSERTRKET